MKEIKFDPENFIKARHLFYSRNFWVTNGKNSCSAAIPLGDNYNYIPNKVNIKQYFDNDLKAIVIAAKNDIKYGEEVLL